MRSQGYRTALIRIAISENATEEAIQGSLKDLGYTVVRCSIDEPLRGMDRVNAILCGLTFPTPMSLDSAQEIVAQVFAEDVDHFRNQPYSVIIETMAGLIEHGKLVPSIKLHRLIEGTGLMETKRLMDHIKAYIGSRPPMFS